MGFAERRQNLFLLLAVSLAAVFVSGCKTAPGVAMRMIVPPGAAVMDIPKDKVFLMASPVSQPMPVFPAGAPKTMNVSACVEMVVDESGAVSSATPIFGLPDCPLAQTEIDQRFVVASLEAVKSWQFLAAAICTFPPEAPKNDDCSGVDVAVSPVAVKLSYVFSFQSGRVTAQARRA
jgi:hypothetical protein